MHYAPARTDSDATPASIRIVTFNVKFAEDVAGAITVIRDTPELRGADLIALQEMDERGVDRIARALSWNGVYYAASVHPNTGKTFGPALLSPWPITRGWKVLLPHQGYARAQRRVATGAEVLIGRLRVRAYSVHLEMLLRMSEEKRTDQARAVLEDAADWPGPVVVAGDLNDDRMGTIFESRGYAWVTRGVPRTVGIFSYDHIFARGLGGSPGEPASGVADARGSSDHRPVWAVVEVPEGR